ncbi:MAG: NUDIX domain-containing protein, partial [Lachnospirales bacterium]
MSYEVLKSEKVYEGRVIDVERDIVSMPDGKEAIRETVIHGGAAAMLPIDEKGKILLVRQYRHSAKAMTLELPAGTIENGESPYDCAVREIEEETGYKCYHMEHLITMYSAIGFCNEQIHIFVCKDLIDSKQHTDEDEFITIEKYSLKKCLEL